MKTLPLIIGLVAAGTIGALAATAMQPVDGSTDTLSAPREDPRVDELMTAVARLDQEVADLKATPPVVRNVAVTRMAAVPRTDIAGSPMDAVSADAAPAAAAVQAEQFEKAVAKVVAKTRQKEMEAIGKMWTSRAAQREKDMVTQFAEDQNLTDYQRDEMIQILDERRKNLSPHYRAMFTPPADGETRDYAKIREDMQKVRDETTTEMKSLLDVDQVEAFEKQEQSRRGGWWMGGSRRNSGSSNNIR